LNPAGERDPSKIHLEPMIASAAKPKQRLRCHIGGERSAKADGPDDYLRDELAAEVLGALKELDAHGHAGLPLMLRFGEALSNAKEELKYNQFGRWCREALRRSPSWCSAYRRLYESRADLESALAWAAATRHRWANCRSVERLLKIVADWRKVTQGDGAAAPRTRRKKRATVAHLELEEIAPQLQKILAEAEGAFETVRFELWLMAPPDDDSAKGELVALGKRFRSRLRELDERCSALQRSKMAEVMPDDLPDVDDARLLQLTRDAHAISHALAARIDELVRELLPNGRAQDGTWRVGGLDGARGGSLVIALARSKHGLWIDHATGEKGDALDLVKDVRYCNTREAIEWSKKWLARDGGQPRAPAQNTGDSDDEAHRIERALAIWGEAIDPRNTLVEAYLLGRALKLTDALADDVLRYHRGCPWHDEATGRILRVPAMVVAMRSIATDDTTAIQRTRLSPEGKKVEQRMLGVVRGAAVKLDADKSVTDRLYVGEGVETCMSARQIGLRPTWALGSAGAIENFSVWDGINTLTILAEGDKASERAVETCGARWHQASRQVFINRSRIGKDLNDALQHRSRRSSSGRRSTF
jgi:Toprim domain